MKYFSQSGDLLLQLIQFNFMFDSDIFSVVSYLNHLYKNT